MDLLRSIIEHLALRFPSRNGSRPSALSGAAEYLESELRDLGLDVESAWYGDGRLTVRNLVVHRSGGEAGSSSIVVGAHYDTVVGTPGADDNASGVAGVIELARRFARIRTRHALRFVLFPHEEPPYTFTSAMGSRQYASACHREGRSVALMMALEMIGYASSDLRQHYPFPLMRMLGRYPREADFIAIVGNRRSRKKVRLLRRGMESGCSIRIQSLIAPASIPPFNLSDHSSFWKYGLPAVMITDTAFLRNPHYHRHTDTPATLNFDFLGQVVDGLEAGIRLLDAEG